MNARLFQFRYSAERDVVELFLKASIGASGAPTLTLQKQIASMTRNSAGNYTIVLRGNADKLLEVSQCQQSAAASTAPLMRVVSEQVNNTSSASLIVQFTDAAGVAADIASGAILMMRITLRNAST